MRHYKKGRKLGTDWSHTKAMKRSLVKSLFENDRIKTVEERAKEIRPNVDKIITWAKRGDLHSRRLAIAALGNDKELVREIFEKVEKGMFADRQGGYTRIMKLGFRKGDNASMVIMELCTEPVAKKDEKPAAKKATPKKVVEEAAIEEIAEAAEVEAEGAEVAEIEAEEAVEAVEAEDAAAEVVEAGTAEVEAVVEDAAEAAVEEVAKDEKDA